MRKDLDHSLAQVFDFVKLSVPTGRSGKKVATQARICYLCWQADTTHSSDPAKERSAAALEANEEEKPVFTLDVLPLNYL